MRPIDTIPEDDCRDLLGVVFDIDDTVTTAGRLDPAAYAAMWALRDAGLKLVPVTGRPLGWADVIVRHWPVDVAVGENGAGWVWLEGGPAGLPREGYFDGAAERAEQAARLRSLVTQMSAAVPAVSLAADQRARRCDLAFDIGEFHHSSEAELASVRAIIDASGARCLISSVQAHVALGWNKALGASRAIAEALGVDVAAAPQRWLFVGDSGNDGDAFDFFPVSAGVANVRAHLHRLPRPPAYVAQAECGAGFAEISRTILAQRGIAGNS